jgi:hypothetical protein
MKKLLLLVLCVVVPMAGFAQKKKKKKGAEPVEVAPAVVPLTDEECLEKVSLFQSFVKIGDWSAAYENWLPVYQSRPDFRSQIYTNGAKILDYRYQNAATDEAKLA